MPHHTPKGVRYGGRAKGTPNRVTQALKDIILEAAHGAHPDGAKGYLQAQAIANPQAFMSLLGRVLPMQVTGEGGGALKIKWEE